MQGQFSQYGMCYGWLGKQAALFVDHVVALEEYDGFIALAQVNQPEVTKLIDAKAEVDGIALLDRYKPLKAIVEGVVNPVVAAVNQGVKATNNKKIEAQQYSCLTLLFYLKGLSSFLGLDEL